MQQTWQSKNFNESTIIALSMSSTTIPDGDLTKDEILVEPDTPCNSYEWELQGLSGVTRNSSLVKFPSDTVVELVLKPMIVTSNSLH